MGDILSEKAPECRANPCPGTAKTSAPVHDSARFRFYRRLQAAIGGYWAQKRRVAPTEVATVKTFLIAKTLSFLV
jgi:hypothetical protein